jgi:hypothetical protein
MLEVVYRCDPKEGPVQPRPSDGAEARLRLLQGNERFAKATQALERNGITKLSAENEYRQRLVETSIMLNAAMTARTLQQAMSTVPSSGYQC